MKIKPWHFVVGAVGGWLLWKMLRRPKNTTAQDATTEEETPPATGEQEGPPGGFAPRHTTTAPEGAPPATVPGRGSPGPANGVSTQIVANPPPVQLTPLNKPPAEGGSAGVGTVVGTHLPAELETTVAAGTETTSVSSVTLAKRLSESLKANGCAGYSRQLCRDFQRAVGLPVDGLYGKNTSAKLKGLLGNAPLHCYA